MVGLAPVLGGTCHTVRVRAPGRRLVVTITEHDRAFSLAKLLLVAVVEPLRRSQDTK